MSLDSAIGESMHMFRCNDDENKQSIWSVEISTQYIAVADVISRVAETFHYAMGKTIASKN